MERQQLRDEDVHGRQQVVVARVVHSQVRRIKEEEDDRAKVHETFQHQVAEMRLVLRDVARQQRSRSPLGRASRTAISIGGDS